MVDAGYEDFADRWNPILDVFDEVGVRFAHEVHPSEIAYDYWTTVRALEAIGHRDAFGLNWDPSHFVWQDLDPVGFIWDFRDRIYHVDCKDTKRRSATAATAASARTSPGRTRAAAGTSSPPATATCRGRRASGCSTPSATTDPISVEWEDAGMDRLRRRPRGARVRAGGSRSTRRRPRSTPPSPPSADPGPRSRRTTRRVVGQTRAGPAVVPVR